MLDCQGFTLINFNLNICSKRVNWEVPSCHQQIQSMSNLRQFPKPNADITDFEWERTPWSVQILIDRLQELLRQKQKNLESLELENQWLREQLDLQLDKPFQSHTPSPPEVILWATIGLLLTIGGTFVQAHTINGPWDWSKQGIQIQTLEVSYQIGAVLLTGCVGGKNAALLSQLAYVILGLTWLPIFERGGGWDYVTEPGFGYLLGFIVGAWLCGYLAFKTKARLQSLTLSCLVGFGTIHLIGIVYLTVLYYWTGLGDKINSLVEGITIYSIYPLPGQLAILCAVTLVAFVIRKLMFS